MRYYGAEDIADAVAILDMVDVSAQSVAEAKQAVDALAPNM